MFNKDTLLTIQQLYVAYYGRPADKDGLLFWAAALEEANNDVSAILEDFGQSAEYQETLAGLNSEQQVRTLYQQMFDRNPDSGGLSFWSKALNNGLDLADAALSIAQGATGSDAQVLADRTAVAQKITDALDTPEKVAAFNTQAGQQAIEQLFAEDISENNNVLFVSPGSDVQAVVDQAGEGDVILLGAGEYNGDISTAKGNITLKGVGDETVINGQIKINDPVEAGSVTENVTLSDFTLNAPGDASGIITQAIDDGTYNSQNIDITGVNVNASLGGVGIGLFDADEVFLSDLTIDFTLPEIEGGIFNGFLPLGSSGIQAAGLSNAVISNSLIDSFFYGVLIYSYEDVPGNQDNYFYGSNSALSSSVAGGPLFFEGEANYNITINNVEFPGVYENDISFDHQYTKQIVELPIDFFPA